MLTQPQSFYRTTSTRKKSNPMGRFLLLVILLVVIFFGAKLYWHHLNSPVDPQGIYQDFTIARGESTNSIGDKLVEDKLIRSSLVFKSDLELSSNHVLPSGNFKISPAESTPEVIQTLQNSSQDINVTLLEGWRVEEMADKLNQALGIDKATYIKEAKEGYMFPDTYSFSPDASIESIISTQEDNFSAKYTDDLQNQMRAQGLTPTQGVILASIVEREARSDQARTMVASILLKRLKIGMALNADSTIQYMLGYQSSESSWWKSSITQDDKAIQSPYNTYLNAGLPPAPICNPSLASFKAVANADPNTPYLYYYHDSKGNAYYAKTLDEQNANVANHP